jgi:hypothetical protein
MNRIVCAALVLACATVPSLADDPDKQTKMDGQEKSEKEMTAAAEKAEKDVKAAWEKAEKKAEKPWDIAFGAALLTDYNFRGISSSDHRPAASTYFEPRYELSHSLQAYLSIMTNSLSFGSRNAVAIEILSGVRPTFDRLTLDFGFWEHWLPGGQCFNFRAPGGLCIPQLTVLHVNSEPGDISYWEVYGKRRPTTWTRGSRSGGVSRGRHPY